MVHRNTNGFGWFGGIERPKNTSLHYVPTAMLVPSWCCHCLCLVPPGIPAHVRSKVYQLCFPTLEMTSPSSDGPACADAAILALPPIIVSPLRQSGSPPLRTHPGNMTSPAPPIGCCCLGPATHAALSRSFSAAWVPRRSQVN